MACRAMRLAGGTMELAVIATMAGLAERAGWNGVVGLAVVTTVAGVAERAGWNGVVGLAVVTTVAGLAERAGRRQVGWIRECITLHILDIVFVGLFGLLLELGLGKALMVVDGTGFDF